jgi:hypothetical protein
VVRDDRSGKILPLELASRFDRFPADGEGGKVDLGEAVDEDRTTAS